MTCPTTFGDAAAFPPLAGISPAGDRVGRGPRLRA